MSANQHDWLRIMQRCYLIIGDESSKKHLLIVNSILFAILTTASMRMGFSSYLIDDGHHMYGHTFANTGNTAKLAIAALVKDSWPCFDSSLSTFLRLIMEPYSCGHFSRSNRSKCPCCDSKNRQWLA